MAPRVLLDSEHATVWYHTDCKVVHHKFHKPIGGDAFRAVLNTGAGVFEKHAARKWLSDDRANGALHPDDAAWAIEEWSPRVVKAGWEHWAIVMPDAALGRINMKRFVNRYADLGVTVRIFDDPDEALVWLRKPTAEVA
jgi:hypothetical protein